MDAISPGFRFIDRVTARFQVSGSADKLMLLAAHYMLLSLDISYGKRSLYFSSTEMYHLESFDLKFQLKYLQLKELL